MAMACLRLLTRPPLPPFPLRSVPCFRLRIALATSRLELRLYLRRLVRRAMSIPPGLVRVTSRRRMCKRRAARKRSGVAADNHHDRRARLSDARRDDPVRRVWPRASLRGRSPLQVLHVVELELSPRVAKEGAATAHVPAPHELRREVEPRAEDFLEREDVLPGGDHRRPRASRLCFCLFDRDSGGATCSMGFGSSRTTEAAGLSLRRPRKDGWRIRPSSVHSLKLTSATSSGLTQCGRPTPAGGVAKRHVSRSRGRRRLVSSRNVFSVNPVPTFPV